MAPLPTPVRAALGLVANAVDVARTLPDRAVELPVLAVSTALQISLRAQQRYTELTLRGDEVLGRLHAPPEEPPSWATFDDELPQTAPADALADALADSAGADSAGSDSTPLADSAPSADSAPPAEPPADIPISTPTDAAPAPVKSAAKRPRARKTTAAAAKTTAKSQTAKPVRAPRQAEPSAFDRTEE